MELLLKQAHPEVLDRVIQTAREAGALIRAEFERRGGPRGSLGQCPVDEQAELLIRDRLRTEFPNWQFFGEETGTTGEPSKYHWLIDSHDGTSAFQRGHRGSAVSIALLVVQTSCSASCTPPVRRSETRISSPGWKVAR